MPAIEEFRIVLSGRAKAAHDTMLAEILSDKRTSISSSRLINWIVVDYFEQLFRRRKKQLCKEHFNERKCLQEAMKIEDPEGRCRALQEAVKLLSSSTKASKPKKEKSVPKVETERAV